MREVTIAVYLLLLGAAVVLVVLPRVDPDRFGPAASVLEDIMTSLPARLTILVFWWWLGWHFLVG